MKISFRKLSLALPILASILLQCDLLADEDSNETFLQEMLYQDYFQLNANLLDPVNDDLQLPKFEPFIISYSFLVKNEIPNGEKYNVIRPLTKKNLSVSFTCEIDIRSDPMITDDESEILRSLLVFYKDDVINCLQKQGISIISDELKTKDAIKSKTLLKLPPTRVNAGLDNGYLILEVLK